MRFVKTQVSAVPRNQSCRLGMEEDSTSVSSGLGASGRHLKANANISTKTKWLKGRNFFDVPSQKAADQWVSQL